MTSRGSDDSLTPENRGPLTTGNKAVYPGQGPCNIASVVKRVVDATETAFYHLTVLDNRGDLFVPVEKAQAIGVRLLMEKREIPGLLAQLERGTKPADNWKQRATDNLKLFATGSPYDLAEVVASLTELQDTRSLTLGESGTLERARRLLICEISEVMGETRAEVEEQVDHALRAPKKNRPAAYTDTLAAPPDDQDRVARRKLQLVNSTMPARGLARSQICNIKG